MPVLPTTSFSPETILGKVATGKPYTRVLLKTGPCQPAEEERDRLQMGHLAHLFTLESKGKLHVFGPVQQDAVLQGLLVFALTEPGAVSTAMEADPRVQAGLFTWEAFPFFSIPGQRLV
ncbi:MAG TPA: YciI family protein [Chitinophagaceae bacterium]|jgi:uncharacterized protein YciI|nr:YciI family protein [Chitinophagaceae bacterium]